MAASPTAAVILQPPDIPAIFHHRLLMACDCEQAKRSHVGQRQALQFFFDVG
jgi:hypothetical protein